MKKIKRLMLTALAILGMGITPAQGAQGQMQALGYANQLASHQANQLLQLRSLMIAMYSAQIARMQAVADREALHQATVEKFRRGTFVRSEGKVW